MSFKTFGANSFGTAPPATISAYGKRHLASIRDSNHVAEIDVAGVGQNVVMREPQIIENRIALQFQTPFPALHLHGAPLNLQDTITHLLAMQLQLRLIVEEVDLSSDTATASGHAHSQLDYALLTVTITGYRKS